MYAFGFGETPLLDVPDLIPMSPLGLPPSVAKTIAATEIPVFQAAEAAGARQFGLVEWAKANQSLVIGAAVAVGAFALMRRR